MTNIADIRPELQHFAARMEKKLRANDHKAHWRGMLIPQMLERLREELRELEEAYALCESKEAVADEAADVANFAMFIADSLLKPCTESEREGLEGDMKVLDLFSGIGGFSLGLERAGMTTVAFCEIDPFCQKVLAKHWPGVPIYDDVRKLTAEQIGFPDVICGGFPCQDASTCQEHRTGASGQRTGLFREMVRAISMVRPKYSIMENVAGLLDTGMEHVNSYTYHYSTHAVKE